MLNYWDKYISVTIPVDRSGCLTWRTLSLSRAGWELRREGRVFWQCLSILCDFMRFRGWLCVIHLFLYETVDFLRYLLILWKCLWALPPHIWYLFYLSFWLMDRLMSRNRNWCFFRLMFRMLLWCLVYQPSSCECTRSRLLICLAGLRVLRFFGYGIR